MVPPLFPTRIADINHKSSCHVVEQQRNARNNEEKNDGSWKNIKDIRFVQKAHWLIVGHEVLECNHERFTESMMTIIIAISKSNVIKQRERPRYGKHEAKICTSNPIRESLDDEKEISANAMVGGRGLEGEVLVLASSAHGTSVSPGVRAAAAAAGQPLLRLRSHVNATACNSLPSASHSHVLKQMQQTRHLQIETGSHIQDF